MIKTNLKYLFISLILILSLTLATGCAMPYVDISPAPSQSPEPSPPPAPAPPPTPINPTWTPPPTPTVNQTTITLPNIADVVALVKPSVVAITTEVMTSDFFNRPFTQQGAGSGWILDEDGIIVTNNHVVEGAKSITVTLDDGRTLPVDINSVFTDGLNDLAILKIDAQNLPALKIGDSPKMRTGEWVVAIGNALGQGIRATEGIISRKNVSIPVSQGQTLFDLIETSAAINPGNSGGPLVNLAGEVIGITSAKVASIGVEGMGYAISTETAIPIIEELIKNGYVVRPWLGVVLYTVDEFAVMRYELVVNEGVLVTQLASPSPAADAGLDAGDVIVSIDGEKIATAEELIRIIHSSKIGQTLEITFWRGNTQNSTEAVLAESPPPA
ncbi:MAG TPA: trypsin-like peptidase domain-containing protein [Dehalococcoidales bacterium]|nr:trypsin-like peptidase domain-containing protein [Dehalococcoidales bacterium]